MRQRLIYWIFQRGKNCKHCCLWCEYYDLCRADVLAQNEREENHGKERADTKRRYLAGRHTSWGVCQN